MRGATQSVGAIGTALLAVVLGTCSPHQSRVPSSGDEQTWLDWNLKAEDSGKRLEVSHLATRVSIGGLTPQRLQVVDFGPRRVGPGLPEIFVTFNQPMVISGEQHRVPIGTGIVTIQPAVKANYYWEAGERLIVVLRAPLQSGQTYRVQLSPRLSSIHGNRLTKPFSWTFVTERPQVQWVEVQPSEALRAKRLRARDWFLVSFNLKMDAAQVEKHVRLLADGKPVRLRARPVKGKPTQVAIHPVAPYPPGAKLELRLLPSLRSREGPLPMGARVSKKYEVHRPLTVSLRCDGDVIKPGKVCWPGPDTDRPGFRVVFSEPVTLRELRRHLRIVPSPKKGLRALNALDGGYNDEKNPHARTWAFSSGLKPRRRQRIRLTKGLKDIYGQRLGRSLSLRFVTRGRRPSVRLADESEGVRESWHPYRFGAMNLRQIKVGVRKLSGSRLVRFLECVRRPPKAALPKDEWYVGWLQQTWWPRRCLKGAPQKSVRFNVTGRRDRYVPRTLPTANGFSLLSFRSPGLVDDRGHPRTVHAASNQTSLGLHARVTAYGILAWVTSLKTGAPIAKARVTLYDAKAKRLWSGLTDSRGLAQAKIRSLEKTGRPARTTPRKPWRPPVFYVLAETRADRAHLRLHQGQSWNTQEDGAHPPLAVTRNWEGPKARYRSYISTERGIYRPGQTVHVHGAVRRFNGWRGRPAKGLTVRLRFGRYPVWRSPVLLEKRVTLSEFGVFKTTLKLPTNLRLGLHQISLSGPGQSHSHRLVIVAEYRPPRFAVRLGLTPTTLQPGGRIGIDLRAHYFTGQPLSRSEVRLKVTRSVLERTAVAGQPDFFVGCADGLSGLRGTEERDWYVHRKHLDRRGRLKRRLALGHTSAEAAWPSVQRVEAMVRSPAGRTVTLAKKVRHNPADVLPAYKQLSSRRFLRRRLLVVTPTGEPRGGHQVLVTMLAMKDEQVTRRVLLRRTYRVGRLGRIISIRWPRGYKPGNAALVYTVTDKAGRRASSAEQVEHPTSDYSSEIVVDDERTKRPRLLRVSTNKKDYLPGERAKVTVTRRGIRGTGMLFVERERVFAAYPLRFDRRGKATVSVPVKSRYAQQVNLSAVVVQSGKRLRKRPGPIAVGRCALHVSDRAFHLQVKLTTDRPRYRPRDRVKVRVRVHDGTRRSRRAQVVLMAVDEAVLRLTGYQLPDPFEDLRYTPAEAVLAADVREQMAELLSRSAISSEEEDALGALMGHTVGDESGLGGLGLSGGARGRHPKGATRRRFLTTAWHHLVTTNARGEASASFTLPDNLTTYRIMAFAVDADRSAGTGKTSLRVDQPLMTLGALPRFARVGDRFQGGLIVSNAGESTGLARVSLRVVGSAIALTGKKSQTFTLRRGDSTTVRFPMAARQEGSARIVAHVQLGASSDTLEQTLRVTRPMHKQVVSAAGQTTGAARIGLGKLASVAPSYGGLELSVASTALVGLEDGLEQLIDYPYGCLEQRSSRLLASIAAVALAKRLGRPPKAGARGIIQTGLRGILAMQQADGGFAYWSTGSRSWAWATAYALVVLRRVKQTQRLTGATIPQGALDRATSYLRKQLRLRSPAPSQRWAERSLFLYALALHGQNVRQAALKAYTTRKDQPIFAQAMLLAVLAEAGGRARSQGKARTAVRKLVAELTGRLRTSGDTAYVVEGLQNSYARLMHSDTRSTAMLLVALLRAAPRHPAVRRLVRWLMEGRKQARFRNTQEAAWAVMALWDYARIIEGPRTVVTYGVWLGRHKLAVGQIGGTTLSKHLPQLAMSRLRSGRRAAARDLVFAKRGTGTLFWAARLRYANRSLPKRAVNRGLKITRSIQVLDLRGKPVASPRPPRLGEEVIVTLKVSSGRTRRFVVIDDPLPAGMEAIDESLSTSRSFGIWRRSFWQYAHQELRDDRVLFFTDHLPAGIRTYRYRARVTTPGTFVVPPTRAVLMYTPEIHGHTAARKVSFGSPARRRHVERGRATRVSTGAGANIASAFSSSQKPSILRK